MECLLFLWWNFALYLACYLHDTLHCNIYMDGTMCMDGTSLCMNNVYGWNWCDMWYETYVLDMCWICDMKLIYFLCKLWDLIKNRKNRQYAGSLPSATDGKELFAVCRGRQRACTASFLFCFSYIQQLSQEIYHIKYITGASTYISNIINIQHIYIHPSIHSRLHIVPSIHTYYNMQSFIIAI